MSLPLVDITKPWELAGVGLWSAAASLNKWCLTLPLQGGGHSILSPVYGLGVDRVVSILLLVTERLGSDKEAAGVQDCHTGWPFSGS